MLLYACEVWGISRPANIETAHLFACQRLLSVSDKTPNHMVYGETGRYPLYIDSTISSLKYWFRFPRQALIMLKKPFGYRHYTQKQRLGRLYKRLPRIIWFP